MINLDDGRFQGLVWLVKRGLEPALGITRIILALCFGLVTHIGAAGFAIARFAGLGRMEVVQMTYFARSAFTGSEALNRVANKNIPPIFR